MVHRTVAAAMAAVSTAFVIMLAMAGNAQPQDIGGNRTAYTQGAEEGQVATGWKATTPSGITVELLGVAADSQQGDHWWNPDGIPMPRPSYDELVFTATQLKGNEKGRTLVFRISPAPNAKIDTRVHIEASKLVSYDVPSSRKSPAVHDLLVTAGEFRSDQRQVTARVGIAAGPWKREAVDNGKMLPLLSHVTPLTNGGILFSPASVLDGKVAFTVSDTDLDREVRIVAIDTSGRLVPGENNQILIIGPMRQTTVTFPGLKLKEIKQIEFQTRAYEWVTFKDIALQPRTDRQASF